MNAPLPLLPMKPLFLEKIWGGKRIAALPGKGVPASLANVGESWEVADLPEGQSSVAAGPLAGATLGELYRAHGERLAGTAARGRGERFPLLVKIVDAAEALSVQVHPGADYARTHPGTFSKDESWLVVDAAPGAWVLHGFNDGVDAESFKRGIQEDRVDTLLRRVAVKPGDVLRVSPGTVHAIGPGVTLLEVQEPSDTTFRVYDYGRRDAQGKTRPLHVQQAIEVAALGPQPPALNPRQPGRLGITLVESPHYRMDLLDPALGPWVPGLASAVVLFGLAGSARVEAGDDVVELAQGSTVLVPPRESNVRVRHESPGTQVVAMALPSPTK